MLFHELLVGDVFCVIDNRLISGEFLKIVGTDGASVNLDSMAVCYISMNAKVRKTGKLSIQREQ